MAIFINYMSMILLIINKSIWPLNNNIRLGLIYNSKQKVYKAENTKKKRRMEEKRLTASIIKVCPTCLLVLSIQGE